MIVYRIIRLYEHRRNGNDYVRGSHGGVLKFPLSFEDALAKALRENSFVHNGRGSFWPTLPGARAGKRAAARWNCHESELAIVAFDMMNGTHVE